MIWHTADNGDSPLRLPLVLPLASLDPRLFPFAIDLDYPTIHFQITHNR